MGARYSSDSERLRAVEQSYRELSGVVTFAGFCNLFWDKCKTMHRGEAYEATEAIYEKYHKVRRYSSYSAFLRAMREKSPNR